MRIQIHEEQPLRAEPAADAAVVEVLPKEAKLRVEGFRTVGETSWLSIMLPTGKQGFIPGSTPFTRLSPSADDLLVKSALAETGFSQPSFIGRRAVRSLVFGGVSLAIGLAITAGTYVMASPQGGTYVVAWGAIVFGAIRLALGVWQYRRGE